MHDNRKGNTAESDDVILWTLQKRLEAFGRGKFGNETYESESPQDCVQQIMVRVWQERSWERFPSEDDLYRYWCKAVVNCVRDSWRQAKRNDLLVEDDIDLISASTTTSGSGPADLQRELELAADKEWVLSLCEDDNELLTYLELLGMGKKRDEIAIAMNLEPREVTDLWRKLKRKVKRHLKERRHR